MKDHNKMSKTERWRDFLEILFLAFTLALFLRTFIVGFYRISTGSMAPSLRIGDFVWVSKVSYGFDIPFTDIRLFESLPQKGDLVLFRYPDQPQVVHLKRVIGLPGDHIHIERQQILVNGEPFKLEKLAKEDFSEIQGVEFMRFYRESYEDESYTVMFAQTPETSKEIGPLVVPPGEIFVMGDNRDASDDSRYWGAIPMSHVEAKALGIWFSLDWTKPEQRDSPKFRWDRVKLLF